jgi:hypothetical protein
MARAAVLGALGLATADAVADDVIVLEDGPKPGILWRTDSKSEPGALYVVSMIGLESDENVLAIDSIPLRPGSIGPREYLYGLTEKRLYRIDPNSGQATAVGPRFASDPLALPVPSVLRLAPDLAFDPASGLGFVVGTTEGVRASVDPLTGRRTDVHVDADTKPAFAYVEGDPGFGKTPDIAGVACTGNTGDANSWTMFGVDRTLRTLVRIGSVGGLQVATDDRSALTTVAAVTGVADGAYPAALTVEYSSVGYVVTEEGMGNVGVYRLDLTTGVATLKRSDRGWGVRDAAVLPLLLPEPPLALDVTSAVVRYDFRPSRTNGGTIVVTGTLPYPADGLAGRVIQLDLDGVVREFTTDAKGRAKSGPDQFRFVGKLHAGTIRYEITIRKAALADVAGVDARTTTGPRAMTADLFLDGRAYRTRIDVDYFAGRGRGVAKTP